MTCEPSFAYRPTDRPEPAQSSAPLFTEHRSRLTAGGTFFRSIDQGIDENDISLEATTDGTFPLELTLTVRVLGVIEETFVVQQTFVPGTPGGPGTPPVPPPTDDTCIGGISALRAAVNDVSTGSLIIEMTARGFDIFDGGTDPADNCLTAFADTPLTGGDGPPSNASQPFLDSIFTGQRTMIIIDTTEDITGFPVTPGPSKRVQQYDGTDFISYCNLVQGNCPLEGTC